MPQCLIRKLFRPHWSLISLHNQARYLGHYLNTEQNGMELISKILINGTSTSKKLLKHRTMTRDRKRGSSVVRHLPLVLEVPGSIPARGEENFGVRTRFP